METLKVSSKSEPKKVASAIANSMREHGKVEIHAVGAGAVNVTVKASIIAKGYVAPSGIELVLNPSFHLVEIEGQEKTAIKFVVQGK